MGKKNEDLQPWLDYFGLLQKYEEKGFLEVKPEEHEAYVTRAALWTLLPDGEGSGWRLCEIPSGHANRKNLAQLYADTQLYVQSVANCIRAYAGFRSQQGADYLKKPFALHVVAEDMPHDLVNTIVLTPKKNGKQNFEVIAYKDKQIVNSKLSNGQ